MKKLENRDNKVNPTNKESKKLINIVRRRNDYDWGRGRNQRNTFFLAMNWIPYDTQGKGSIDQTLDEIWDTTTGNMKIFENGLWIIPENEFSIIDIAVQRVGKKDKVSLTKDKKFIIVGLIKNDTEDGYLFAHFERVAENMKSKRSTKILKLDKGKEKNDNYLNQLLVAKEMACVAVIIF